MPDFFALVDAVPGREDDVKRGLDALPRILSMTRVKEGVFDWLIRFEAPAATKVDDFLQTYVRTIPGVKGVEPVFDWDDVGSATREARDRLV